MVQSSMTKIESSDVIDGPVVSEGGRSPSTLSPGHIGAGQGAGGHGPLTPGQRWSAARKREVVLRLLRGEFDRTPLPRARPADLQARAVA